MKWIKYSRYTGEDFGIDSEDLLRALSDYLLQSGFNAQNMRFSEFNEHSLEDLKRAIQQALESGQLFSDEHLEKMMEQLQALKNLLTPHEVLFVASAATGQDAVKTAHEFDKRIAITGTILTMLDGSARAGAANGSNLRAGAGSNCAGEHDEATRATRS